MRRAAPGWLGLGLGLGLALLLAQCGRPRAVEARPPLWRVADRDTTIWLLGSIHALPPRVRWRTAAVSRAEAEADTLILEIAPAAPRDAVAAFSAAARAPGLPPLRDRVAAADRGLVERAMAAAGHAPGSLDGLGTWAAALSITAGAMAARGVSAANGVEDAVAADFAGKRIGALETRDGQLALFDALPEAEQRVLLLQAAHDALAGGNPAFAAWRRGDEAALTATLAPLAAHPALARRLVSDRNARWASAIVRRLARPGRVLVVVGAGHLVGPRSVIARLRARGLRVERID